MSINLSLARILACILIAIIAVLCSLAAVEWFHASAAVALGVFGFVLIALNASVTIQ